MYTFAPYFVVEKINMPDKEPSERLQYAIRIALLRSDSLEEMKALIGFADGKHNMRRNDHAARLALIIGRELVREKSKR